MKKNKANNKQKSMKHYKHTETDRQVSKLKQDLMLISVCKALYSVFTKLVLLH